MRSTACGNLFMTATNVVRGEAIAQGAAGRHEPLPENEHALRSMEDEDRLALRKTIRLLETELPNLGASTRRVFLLHHAKRMSFEEIARELGMSTRTVEQEMSQALSHMQTTLGGALRDVLE
ncbi:MAG TPA: sigma factor-like helix-turn-helix DNA-binding protein [Rhizomicrobium sp.]|nr:sigma factor-like helix-turn-helix DNA-binding protein [Rhizomicrobium sp.]